MIHGNIKSRNEKRMQKFKQSTNRSKLNETICENIILFKTVSKLSIGQFNHIRVFKSPNTSFHQLPLHKCTKLVQHFSNTKVHILFKVS